MILYSKFAEKNTDRYVKRWTLYDEYFLSYAKLSVFFGGTWKKKKTEKMHYFCNNSKSIRRRAFIFYQIIRHFFPQILSIISTRYEKVEHDTKKLKIFVL